MKGDQVMAEVIVIDGSVRIRCRHCLRFHAVTVRQDRTKFFDIQPIPEGDGRDLVSNPK